MQCRTLKPINIHSKNGAFCNYIIKIPYMNYKFMQGKMISYSNYLFYFREKRMKLRKEKWQLERQETALFPQLMSD